MISETEAEIERKVEETAQKILEKGEKLKDGVAFFAIRSGAKIVPCGIKGGTKENKKVTITYGKPLDYSQYKGSKDKEVLEKITNEVMENIIELTK